jgi:phage minor structural protein
MIPILYSENTTQFNTNGLGRLDDLIDCTVTEERNGEFYLIATIPITSRMYPLIGLSKIIYAVAHDGDDGQAFRISKISKPFDGKVEIEAQHISYQLSWIPLKPFTAVNCPEAISKITTMSAENNPFTFWTDIQTVANYSQDVPASVRSRLGGTEGSLLDVYGGEYEFDNYTVKLHSARGQNKGVTLRYGKNITDIKQEESIESTYTGICPYWQGNEDTLVTISGYVVESEYASHYPFNRTKVVDFSSEFENEPTGAQLLAAARSYINRNNIGVPSVSIDVSFVALWQTEEYKDIANLERVQLCDTVTVLFDKLDIAVTAKVVRTEYDVLMERYNEITIGSVSSSLATTISDMDNEVTQNIKAAKSEMQKAINNATAQITGAKGGDIQTHFNADGEPYEMTIANNKNLASATKVWRWNIGGLGFSNTGYDGQYRTAITQDGSIVADFITTGTLDASKATITNINASNINTGALNASLITTGTLDASKATITNINASNIKTGTLNGSLVTVTNLNAGNIIAGTIKNKNNNNTYWNLDTGAFKTTDATIVNATCTGSFYAESGGTWVELKNGELHGSKSGYAEIGTITFNKVINSGSNHYDAMSIEAYKDLHIRGHLWVDPDGGGAYRVLDDANIEIVNWIQWVTQRSSGVEWVKEGTEMGCGRATFHCGMLCQWTQFENVIVGD